MTVTATNIPADLYLDNRKLVQEAQAAISSFERSNQAGVWPYLDKVQVVADMRSRVDNPFLVYQGGQPFCGPTAILFELVRKQPVKYVQICQSLFETGSFQSQTKHIQALDRLRQNQGQLRMAMADWLVLSTLRDAENIIFPVDPSAPDMMRNLSGMTKSWEMQGWVKEVLGYAHVKYYHTYLYGEFDALREASNAIAAGGVAFGLITAEGLLQNKPPMLPFPSHWIGLLGNILIDKGVPGKANSGHFSFDIYTWAKAMKIDADEQPLEDYFWGVVMGWN